MCQKKIMRKRSSEHLSDEPPKKRVTPAGNILPTQVSPGEIFTDLTGKQWKLGKAIGFGGFGEIYLASDNIRESVRNDAKYVIKVENHSNGPLFVEINCLLRIAKLHMIEKWKKNQKITQLGVPHYVASGSHMLNSQKLRFLVISRFQQDFENIFVSKNKKINLKTVILICIQILDALEYIHDNGYVHCDIKASNILYDSFETSLPADIIKEKLEINDNKATLPKKSKLRQIKRVNYEEDDIDLDWYEDHELRRLLKSEKGLRNTERINYKEGIGSPEIIFEYKRIPLPIVQSKVKEYKRDQVILIDYGLATKYLQSDGRHKQFCNDERKAHAGTIPFCSIDAHLGATSRRSDLETLGYNMIYWLTSSLPWESDINNPEIVQNKKEHCLNNLNTFLKSCFNDHCPDFIYEYFKYVKSLTFVSKPDYNFCKKLLQTALEEYGYSDNGQFDFDNSEGWGQKTKKSRKCFENIFMKRQIKSGRIPLASNNIVEKPKLRKKIGGKNSRLKLSWSKISDPEEILRKNRNHEVPKNRERKLTETSESSCNGNSLQNLDIKSLNPTYAMLEVFYKCKDKNANYNGLHKTGRNGDSVELEYREGYTPAMNFILTKMNQRRLEELLQETENIVPARKIKTRNLRTNANKKTTVKKTVKSAPNIIKEIKRKVRSARVLRGHGLRG